MGEVDRALSLSRRAPLGGRGDVCDFESWLAGPAAFAVAKRLLWAGCPPRAAYGMGKEFCGSPSGQWVGCLSDRAGWLLH